MSHHLESVESREAWRTVRRVNEAWLQGRVERMRDVLHERIVAHRPGFTVCDVGRDACIRGYAEFASRAAITSFTVSDVAVDVFGDLAVATYRFAIAYELGGERVDATGHDIFVLQRDEGSWLVVWRSLVPPRRTE